MLGWQVALIVIGVLLWFLAVGLDIVGVVLLILLAREKCKPSTILYHVILDEMVVMGNPSIDLVASESLIVDHSDLTDRLGSI